MKNYKINSKQLGELWFFADTGQGRQRAKTILQEIMLTEGKEE